MDLLKERDSNFFSCRFEIRAVVARLEATKWGKMLIRVREGAYDPQGEIDRDDTLEPNGLELWSGTVDDLAAASLHAADVRADPGTWYKLEQFKALLNAANPAPEGGVYSTVSTSQPGVHKPWTATIEVAERSATLMVCRSVVEHIEQLKKAGDIWIRVE